MFLSTLLNTLILCSAARSQSIHHARDLQTSALAIANSSNIIVLGGGIGGGLSGGISGGLSGSISGGISGEITGGLAGGYSGGYVGGSISGGVTLDQCNTHCSNVNDALFTTCGAHAGSFGDQMRCCCSTSFVAQVQLCSACCNQLSYTSQFAELTQVISACDTINTHGNTTQVASSLSYTTVYLSTTIILATTATAVSVETVTVADECYACKEYTTTTTMPTSTPTTTTTTSTTPRSTSATSSCSTTSLTSSQTTRSQSRTTTTMTVPGATTATSTITLPTVVPLPTVSVTSTAQRVLNSSSALLHQVLSICLVVGTGLVVMF